MASKTIALIMLGDQVMATCIEDKADRVLDMYKKVQGILSPQDRIKAGLEWHWESIPFIDEE